MSDSLWPCVWTVARQSPLPMGFSRQEYWSVLPFPPQGIFLTQGSNPSLLHLLPWQANAWLLSYLESKEWIFSPLYKINKYISISISFAINKPCQRVEGERQWLGMFFIYALGRLFVLEDKVFVIIKNLLLTETMNLIRIFVPRECIKWVVVSTLASGPLYLCFSDLNV